MATEDDVDIEGDFEYESGLMTSVLYDADEPPSKSACLLPEYNQHPWALEQSWSLDHCTDEKSKAAIEKMLQEEKYYLTGRHTVAMPAASRDCIKSDASSTKTTKAWLAQEKKLFRQLLEIYGENWDDIALSLPTKTLRQIKTYGRRILKKERSDDKAKESSDISETEESTSKGPGLPELKTAQPTIAVDRVRKRTASTCVNSPKTEGKDSSVKLALPSQTASSSLQLNDSTVVRIKNVEPDGENDSDIEVDIDVSEEEADQDATRDVYQTLLQAAEDEKPAKLQSDDNTLPDRSFRKGVRKKSCSELGKVDEISDGSEKIGNDILLNGVSEYASNVGGETVAEVKSDLQADVIETEPAGDVSGVMGSIKEEHIVDGEAKIGDGPEAGYQSDRVDACDEDQQDEEEDAHPNEFPIIMSNGQVVYLANPMQATVLEPDVITDQERQIHCEFFDQRPGQKTPDRYLKIRNFILDAWASCQPVYLNKTSVRPGLRNCGDVNCIGRIHSYLEQIGAINFGCDQVQYNKKPAKYTPVKVIKKSIPTPKVENVVPRKRRVRADDGEWIDEKELEGRTIEHREKKPVVKTTRKVYDPFKLQPCKPYSDEYQAPYKVIVDATCMVVMDVHAHLWKTEVMGMLGGKYDSTEGILHLTIAEPCRGVSTGMQCEMDPVSQTVSCCRIMEAGHSVLGWYHSHPTFPPNPSVRDLETQQKYQEWFAKGGTPFLGVIVSPYCAGNLSPESVVQCLVVADSEHAGDESVSGSQSPDTGVPYCFDYSVNQNDWSQEVALEILLRLREDYPSDPNHIPLYSMWKSQAKLSCLQKMFESLNHHLPSDDHAGFFEQMTEMFASGQLAVSPDEVAISDTTGSDSFASFSCSGQCQTEAVTTENDICDEGTLASNMSYQLDPMETLSRREMASVLDTSSVMCSADETCNDSSLAIS